MIHIHTQFICHTVLTHLIITHTHTHKSHHTHTPNSPWGEHEIDYVLFYTIPNKNALTMKPHPDEVDAIQWVSQEQLQTMFNDTNLLFSPWFRIIVQKWFLGPQGWWSNWKECMTTNNFDDFTNIHRFDPPKEHLGGAGKAGPMFEWVHLFKKKGYKINHTSLLVVIYNWKTHITKNPPQQNRNTQLGDVQKKQGAYGKIKTHKESKLTQLSHFDEVWSAITLLYLKPLRSNLETDYIQKTFPAKELEFTDEILGKVSRSFAAVIRQLPSQLLVDVLIFYLVLRALDTIEDEMTAFASHAIKVEHLVDFYKNALNDPTWTLDGIGEGDEKRLLQEFPKCQMIFSKLSADSRAVISDITERMATGMAEFVDKDMGQGTKDVKEYNRYCHFVAGLVGEGLSRLFAASGLEKESFVSDLHLSDQMGLFLQKVNIIRDYLEDYVDGRAWWPQSVWKKYSKSGDLGYFSQQEDPEARKLSLQCLNELVTDALELAPDCLAYMSKLQCVEVFRFCAIPQVMAIATLDALYGNPKVFTGVVKIRKGMSCKLILSTNTMPELHSIFYEFATSIAKKARDEKKRGVVDPSLDRTIKACNNVIELTDATRLRSNTNNTTTSLIVGFVAIVIVFHLLKSTCPPEWLASFEQPADLFFRGIAFVLLSMVFMSGSNENNNTDLETADAILLKKKQLWLIDWDNYFLSKRQSSSKS